jgi:hypothetical protein
MKREIRRLRLEPGDVLLVRSHETAMRLQGIPGHHPFPVPIVVAPEGGVHRLSREYLEKLLARTESKRAGAVRSAGE